jgi:hypothetical protein
MPLLPNPPNWKANDYGTKFALPDDRRAVRAGCLHPPSTVTPSPVAPELVHTIERAIAQRSPQRAGKETRFLCPAHDDHNPSARWNPEKCVWHCDACGAGGRATDLAGRLAETWGAGEGVTTSVKPVEHSNGCTLEAYAAAKRLPVEFLRELGLGEISYMSAPAVRIPYRQTDGSEASIRFRTALHKDPTGADARFKWKTGSKPFLYGLERLEHARERGFVIVPEGESDCHTCWYHDFPAVGLPGAANWNEERDAGHFTDIGTIYVVFEPDQGGATVRRAIASSAIRHRVRVLQPAGFKDLSELYLDDPASFRERLRKAMDDAPLWTEIAAAEDERQADVELERSEGLLDAPDLLFRIERTIAGCGYVGDARPAMAAYMIMTSRLLEKPANGAFLAPSSAGKNRAVDAAKELIPPEAVYEMSAGSDRALIYEEQDFHHRVVIVGEADSIPDEGSAASAVRSIAEDNLMRYDVVEMDPRTKKHVTRHIVKRGPTCLITTSTKPLAEQLSTRMLDIHITDSEQQTRLIMRAHARRVSGEPSAPVRVDPLVSAQRWLQLAGERRVVVPFATALVDLISAKPVRMRRASAQLLACVQAVALLHQRQRARHESGAVVATIDDYAAVRSVLEPTFDSVAHEGLSPAVRETVEVIGEDEEVTEAELARRLNMAKSSISYRVRRALKGGWLIDRETRERQPRRLARGSPLPADESALPAPSAVRALFERSNRSRQGDTPSPASLANRPNEDAARCEREFLRL